MVAQLVGKCSKQVTVANSITKAKYVAALEATNKMLNHIVHSRTYVWFQEGFGQWDTIANSCSIAQSEDTGFDQ